MLVAIPPILQPIRMQLSGFHLEGVDSFSFGIILPSMAVVPGASRTGWSHMEPSAAMQRSFRPSFRLQRQNSIAVHSPHKKPQGVSAPKVQALKRQSSGLRYLQCLQCLRLAATATAATAAGTSGRRGASDDGHVLKAQAANCGA